MKKLSKEIEEATLRRNAFAFAWSMLENTRIKELLATWRKKDRKAENKTRPGPGCIISEYQLIAFMLVLAIRKQPLMFTLLRDLILEASDD